MSSPKKETPYIELNEFKLLSVTEAINGLISGFAAESRPAANSTCTDILYHYTSIEKLFCILEGDSFWASRSRFSNDSTEGEILGEEWINQEHYYGDNYIVCFCGENDKLSQWRGYCPNGGASIGFKFISESTYTICKSGTIEPKNNMELYKNSPLPVIYCRTDPYAENDSGIYDAKENLQNSWKEIEQLRPEKNNGPYKIGLQDIVPYLKSGYFIEESEYRLMFDNSNGELEDYIQFRTLADGTKIPYIIVKCGNLLREDHSLKRYFSEEKIGETFKNHINSRMREPIVIPAGKDQKDICREFTKLFNQHKFDRANNPMLENRWRINPLRIICEGHLPIISITVSPSPKQKYIKEVIERFCKSKYWLQNVEINCSNIPYINPNI